MMALGHSKWRTRGVTVLFLGLVVFLGHFLRFQSYGVYEDDYWAIVPNFLQPLNYLLDNFSWVFLNWPQGRPLNHFLPAALSVFGYKLGGLNGIYVLAFVGLTINALLVFAILRQFFLRYVAIIGATAYVLFPADTTKILLTHAAHVQASMTFLLAGMFLWLRGGKWRWFSYGVATLSLLSYETAFLPFLAIPLLWSGSRRETWRTWLIHLSVCFGIIVLIAYIRLHTGDDRAEGLLADPIIKARMLLTSLLLGPITSLRMLVVGPWIGLQNIAISGLLSVAILAAVVYMLRPVQSSMAEDASGNPSPIWPTWLNARRTRTGGLPWWWFALVGLIMLSGSYALTFINYPPTQEFGRLTSTHVAAGWGIALTMAALAEGCRQSSSRFAPLLTGLICIWLGTLVLYHDYVQREYVRAWQIQQKFWSQVLRLAPEVSMGWSIIVYGAPAEQSRMIGSNSWADDLVVKMLFSTDSVDTKPSLAHLGVTGHLINFRRTGDAWEWNPQFWSGEFETLDRERLVILDSDSGVLSRKRSVDTSVGLLESVAPLPIYPRTTWPDTPLARLLLDPQFSRP